VLSSDQTLVLTRGVASVKDRVLIRGSIVGASGCVTVPTATPRAGPAVLALNFIEVLVFESGAVERAFRTEGTPEEIKAFLKARARYGLIRWARQHLRKPAASS